MSTINYNHMNPFQYLGLPPQYMPSPIHYGAPAPQGPQLPTHAPQYSGLPPQYMPSPIHYGVPAPQGPQLPMDAPPTHAPRYSESQSHHDAVKEQEAINPFLDDFLDDFFDELLGLPKPPALRPVLELQREEEVLKEPEYDSEATEDLTDEQPHHQPFPAANQKQRAEKHAPHHHYGESSSAYTPRPALPKVSMKVPMKVKLHGNSSKSLANSKNLFPHRVRADLYTSNSIQNRIDEEIDSGNLNFVKTLKETVELDTPQAQQAHLKFPNSDQAYEARTVRCTLANKWYRLFYQVKREHELIGNIADFREGRSSLTVRFLHSGKVPVTYDPAELGFIPFADRKAADDADGYSRAGLTKKINSWEKRVSKLEQAVRQAAQRSTSSY